MSLLKESREIDLILSSSGARAACFIGSIVALEEKGYRIVRIAGSSGGAIIAAAYALGWTSDKMIRMSAETPYHKFKDFRLNNLLSISNPSVYRGKELDNYYKQLYGNATLSDFKIDCKISVVTIIGRKRILLDRKSHPNLPVWKAVRMSSTIPFIFPYLKLDGVPVTDGGLIINMFDIFPESKRDGVVLRPRADYSIKHDIQDVQASKLFIWNYLKILIEFFLDTMDQVHMPAEDWLKTIIIRTHNVGGFKFDLAPKEISYLISCGYEAVYASKILKD